MAKEKTKKINMKIVLLIVCILALIVGIGMVCYTYIEKNNKVKIENPEVTMEVKDFGTIKLELYPDMAPNTVANFIALANNGFYDGTTFSRVVKDFMIQGGKAKTEESDENDTETEGPVKSDIDSSVEKGSKEDTKYCIKGEFLKNNFKNTLSHQRGVISMARADYSQVSQELLEQGYNSAASEFFIMTKTTSNLNGNYAAFGRVIEGMDVVDAISNVEVKVSDDNTNEEESNSDAETPVNEPVITSIRVDTKGYDYGVPETVEPFDYTSWLIKQYSKQSSNK